MTNSGSFSTHKTINPLLCYIKDFAQYSVPHPCTSVQRQHNHLFWWGTDIHLLVSNAEGWNQAQFDNLAAAFLWSAVKAGYWDYHLAHSLDCCHLSSYLHCCKWSEVTFSKLQKYKWMAIGKMFKKLEITGRELTFWRRIYFFNFNTPCI